MSRGIKGAYGSSVIEIMQNTKTFVQSIKIYCSLDPE